MIHSFNQFHPAGHGTFFSGLLRTSPEHPRNPFLWIYDCGSNRRSDIPHMVKFLSNTSNMAKINLLCVSHFDGDHVNGMNDLLDKFDVDVLALPYLPFNRRLQLAFEIGSDEETSVDAMLFALDPLGYLEGSGLLGKIGRVLLIKGTEGNIAPEPLEPIELPDDGVIDEPYEVFPQGIQVDSESYPDLLGASNRVTTNKLQVLPANVVGNFSQMNWEFVFFNRPLLPRVLKPGSTVSILQSQVRTIVNNRTTYPTPKDFFLDLRDCYNKHFGTSGPARNDISLCVLSRSLSKRSAGSQCRIFQLPPYPLDVAYTLIPAVRQKEASGLLLAGDVSVDLATVDAMKNHYGAQRWSDIRLMQVPHHGAKTSWDSGVAAKTEHEFCVLCVPTVPSVDKSGVPLHPYPDVLKDLEHKKIVRADYSHSVVYAFHK